MTAQEPQITPKKNFQRFDAIVLASILALCLLIALVFLQGDRVNLRVNEFSWKNKTIGVQDRWFSMQFNRPVDRESIEKNLTIAPSLAGKVSWAGNKLVYTLAELPIYGNNYQVILKDAQSLNGDREIAPYFEVFKSRDRAFIYMGLTEKESGQLILVNVTQKTKTALTPRDLVVTDFKIYPNSDRVLFSAFERGRGNQGIETQQLYNVSTGLNFQGNKKTERLGRVKLVLDAKTYKNLKFDLSNNGKTIVVSRVNRNNPAESSLWVLPEDGSPRPLGLPGNNFLIAPDGNRVAVAQRGGVATISLVAEGGKSEFFPGYETIVGFSKDGSQKFMVRDNVDYTRALVLVREDGTTKELFQTLAPVVNCQLEPREEKILYCLKLGLVQREEQQVNQEAYLAAIDLETVKELPLLVLPNYQDIEISMSPDGVALLFDQIATTYPNASTEIKTNRGEAIVSGRLWLLTLPELETIQAQNKPPQVLPEELEAGFNPQWLP
jgi:hypothetical protein